MYTEYGRGVDRRLFCETPKSYIGTDECSA